MRISPNNLRNLLTVFEKQNGRHSANAKLLCNVGNLVHVYLVELGLWVLSAELFDFGGDRFTGAAPFGPGVEDDGAAVVVEDFAEEVLLAGER